MATIGLEAIAAIPIRIEQRVKGHVIRVQCHVARELAAGQAGGAVSVKLVGVQVRHGSGLSVWWAGQESNLHRINGRFTASWARHVLSPP